MNELDTVQGRVVVVNDDLCDSFFGRFAGTLSLSLWLTQVKSLGSQDSNSSCRH